MQNSLFVCYSNRVELLTEKFLDVIKEPLSSPFIPEIVVVQSQGMKQFLTLEIAKGLGICANIRFVFPNDLLSELFLVVLKDTFDSRSFDVQIMSWAIMDILKSKINDSNFKEIRSYLGSDEDEFKLFQLAHQLAYVFDRYILFRIQMLKDWERRKDNNWQAITWRELRSRIGSSPLSDMGLRFLNVLKAGNAQREDFPQRIILFGISYLPEFHLEILKAVSRYTDVYLFFMNPCKEFWVDADKDSTNPLLFSFGAQGANFLNRVVESEYIDLSEFQEIKEDSLLHMIQSDILHMKDRGKDSQKTRISRDDNSVQIHCCHSRMREMEVLQDQLLKIIEQEKVSPEEIIVMMPEIEPYIPYILSVFNLPEEDPRYISYRISDRDMTRENPLCEPFFQILDLPEGRFTASEVVQILFSPYIMNKFEISEPDLEIIKWWIQKTGIRWAMKGEDKEAHGVHPSEEHTWSFGIKRLLLGYAILGEGRRFFKDILPYDHIEGELAELLGRFLEFLFTLYDIYRKLHSRMDLKGWADFLNDVIERMFLKDEETSFYIQQLRKIMEFLYEAGERSNFRYKVGFRTIRYYLRGLMSRERSTGRFLTEGVTFCSMLPMRSVPFKVVCILGMNGDSYPRQERTLGFDLMQKDPKRGDPSKRQDDRYLFLEAILSARKRLHVSYVGRDIRDNTPVPPSVLVSELMDYIQDSFLMEDGSDILDHIVLEHRMHGFSKEYFKGDGRLFSYNEDYFKAAKASFKVKDNKDSFISALKEAPEEFKRISIRDFVRFFKNPSRFLLNRRLFMELEIPYLKVEDREPFSLDSYKEAVIGYRVLEELLEGESLKEIRRRLMVDPDLPQGAVRSVMIDEIIRDALNLYMELKKVIGDDKAVKISVDLEIEDFKLEDEIENMFLNKGHLRYKISHIHPKDYLDAWIRHILICANGNPIPTYIVGREKKKDKRYRIVKIQRLRDAKEILKDLLQIYWLGLKRPIHFFPESSYKYMESYLKYGDHKKALESAKKIWEGNPPYKRGEKEDPYIRLCFKGRDPFDKEFFELSRIIYESLFRCIENGNV